MIRWNAATTQLSSYAPRVENVPIDLRLDHNECPPLTDTPALNVDADLALAAASYPSRDKVVQQIAERLNVDTANILLSCGGDDIITRCCQAVLDEQSNAITTTPTFEMIPRSMNIAGASISSIEWTDASSPVDAILDAADNNTKPIAIVSPNNPTGATLDAASIRRIARMRPESLILADLAYIEFADEDPTPELLEEPNIVVVRTFSKAFGLAGLRTGYAVASPEIIAALARIGSPYPVSALSLEWLSAVLNWPQLEDALARRVERVAMEREAIATQLQSIGCRVLDSQANFVLAFPPDPERLENAFLDAGIAVRAFKGSTTLDGACRISCPCTEEGLERVQTVLSQLAPTEISA